VAEPGVRIGPYRLLSRLGRGAMGEVWRARDERLDRYVALKVLPAGATGDPERRARVLREARASAAVPHPGVVTLFDVVSDDGDDVLVMELVEGQTLSEVLRVRGVPPLRQALDWLIAITDALAAAHDKGILHRDIKSANVMITTAGAVKVLDFGLAKLRDTGGAAPASSGAPVVTGPLAATTVARRPTAQRPALAAGSVEDTLDAVSDSHEPMMSLDATVDVSAPSDAFQTHAGTLLGTPMYMAPEQVDGQAPDERSEVFSAGVIAYEVLSGRPPYAARAVDELFAQIRHEPPPPLSSVPEPVAAIVGRALAKAPAERFARMAELRDALAAARQQLFAPRRWPYAIALVAVAVLAAVAALWLGRDRTVPDRPGDTYVRRAVDEYDLFYNDKALSSLRAALRAAPDHPRASAYLILIGGGDADRAAAVQAAERAVVRADGKDRALLEAALALVRRGPRAAREALRATGTGDRELAFWAAELAFRAGDYPTAETEYSVLLADPEQSFRGRIYDHHSAVLLWSDEPDEALRIGALYRAAFPGEADAVGVHATTLAAAGRREESIAAAEDALLLAEGEDTLAGLGKVVALAGDLPRARELYTRSLARAGEARRPIRRAALALLQWMDGDLPGARATVAPCLPGGPDAGARTRGACLFVAAVVDPALAEVAAAELDGLAATASALEPAYGEPAQLAALARARTRFFGGGCLVTPPVAAPPPADVAAALDAVYRGPLDFYAAYHVPFFATWATCEHAALLAGRDPPAARALLEASADRAPGRWWLLDDLAPLRAPRP
jgi:serine/threonine protein kinase